jgi:hypothetical protein
MTYFAHRGQISLGEEATPGTSAATSAHFPGIITSAELPDEAIDFKTFKAVGAGRDWNAIAEGKHTLEGSLPMSVIKGDIFFYALGTEKTTGTAVGGGGASTINDATFVKGDTSFTITSAANYTVGDYICMDTAGTHPEVRKITIIDGTTITFDKAIRHDKANGGACAEVIAPFTHVLSVGNSLKSFTVEEAVMDDTANYVQKFNGTYIDNWDTECEEGGELKATFNIKAMNTSAAGTSASTVAVPTTVPYFFDQGAISCFGGTIATVTKFSTSCNNKLKPLHYIRATNGRNAAEINTGNREIELSITAVPQDNTWSEKMRPGAQSTGSTFTALFTRGANDTCTISATEVFMKENKKPMPEENEIISEMTLVARTLSMTFVDSTPYYWMV